MKITCLNRIYNKINLAITKYATKIKKQKDTVSNLYKYWSWYIFGVLTHFNEKANFKFLNFLLSPCRTKDKVKRKRERNESMMGITV